MPKMNTIWNAWYISGKTPYLYPQCPRWIRYKTPDTFQVKHRTYNAPAIEQSVEFNHVQGVVVVGVIVQVDLVIDLFQRPARDVLTVCR